MDRGAEAENYCKQSIDISRSVGDQGTLAGALLDLANIVLYQDQLVRTRKYLDEAIGIYDSMGNTKEEAFALSFLADFEMVGPNLVRAKELYQHSLLLSRQTGDESRVAGRLMDLGIVDTWQGSLDSAAEELNESVKVYRALGERIACRTRFTASLVYTSIRVICQKPNDSLKRQFPSPQKWGTSPPFGSLAPT